MKEYDGKKVTIELTEGECAAIEMVLSRDADQAITPAYREMMRELSKRFANLAYGRLL